MLFDRVMLKIEDYAERVGCSEGTVKKATKLVKSSLNNKRILFMGKKYGGIAAAALYLGGLANREHITIKEMSEKIDENDVTIRNNIARHYTAHEDKIKKVTGLGFYSFKDKIARLTQIAPHDKSKYEEIAKLLNPVFFE